MSPQEEISFRSTEVEEFHVETLVDFSVEPTLELVPPLTVMRVSFFLRSPDVYDSLKNFLQETDSKEIGALVYGLVSSEAKLPCYIACILFELPSIAAGLSWKPVSPPP